MTVDIQYKLKQNDYYLKYLRSHSYWYKYLNRNSSSFKNFEDEVKAFYKLTKVDRFEKTLNTIEMATKILCTMSEI